MGVVNFTYLIFQNEIFESISFKYKAFETIRKEQINQICNCSNLNQPFMELIISNDSLLRM